MTAEQKRAWLVVGSVIACVVGYLVLLPFLGPHGATAAFAVIGVNGLAPFIGRREQTDERDRSISRRAALVGGMASYLAFVLGCMGTWFVAFLWQGDAKVSVHLLPAITFLGGIVLYVVWAVVVLVLYGRHVEADDA